MKGKYKNRARVKVERGYGPRHALNAQEGSEAVPSELPTPPAQPDTRGGALIGSIANQFKDALVTPEGMQAIRQEPMSLAALQAYLHAGLGAGALVGGEGGEEPTNFYHGTAHDFVDFNNDTAFFTPDKKAADLYRQRSIFNQHDVELPEDVYSADELGHSGIQQIADEEGIDLSKGRVLSTPLNLNNTLDLSHLDANFDPANDWDDLHKLGLVEDKWANLEPEAQREVEDEYGGKALWNFLDNELHSTIRSKGYDSVRFNDVDTKGNTHETYGVFDPRTATAPSQRAPTDEQLKFEGYARGAMSVGPRHADNMFQSGTSDMSGYNPSGFYGNVLQPQDVEKMRQAMDAPGRSSLSPIEETLAANPDAQSFYYDQTSGGYLPFGGASGYQGGAVEVPTGIDAKAAYPFVVPATSGSTSPDHPTSEESAALLAALKKGGIKYEDSHEDQGEPRALTPAEEDAVRVSQLEREPGLSDKEWEAVLAQGGYARGSFSVGPRHADNAFADGEDDVPHGRRYRFLTVGERFGEHGHDANYHQGVHLGSHAASVSPNVAQELGLTIDPTGQDPASHFIGDNGQAYYAGDPSYNGPNPTSNSIEYRDYDHGDGGTITPSPGAYTGDQGGGQDYAPQGLDAYLQSYGQQPVDTSGGYTGGIGSDYMQPGGANAYGDTLTGPSGEPLDPSAQIGPDLSQYLSAQDPNTLIAGDVTQASLAPLDIPPADTSPSADPANFNPGGDQSGMYNFGDLPVSNLSAQPPDTQSSGGNMQLINELGYNPSYAYGSSGSGVPTQNAAGYGGQLVGGVLGNFLIPGLGGLIGSQLGKYGARELAKMFQSGPAPGSPGAPSGGGGGMDFSGLFPSGLGQWGQPVNPAYGLYQGSLLNSGDPTGGFYSTLSNPQGSWQSQFGTTPPGSSMGYVTPSMTGGPTYVDSGGFVTTGGTPNFAPTYTGQDVSGNFGDAEYNFGGARAQLQLPPGSVGGSVTGGPPVRARARGDDDVKGKLAGSGHDFSEDKQLWDKILTATYGVQTPTEMLGPVPLKDDPDEESLAAQKGKIAVGPRHADNAHSTDTVPAMLTPREAVLNRNAAELAGRGNIQKLNSEGNQLAEQGVDLAGEDKNMKQKYQRGAARIAPVPLTGPKPTARADLAGIMKYLPMGQLARSAQSQAVMPKAGAVRGYQAGTSATDPLSIYQSKLSTSPLGGGQSLGGGPGPSPFPGPSPSPNPNPGPGPMPVSTMPPQPNRPAPTPMGQPQVPTRPDALDPTKQTTTPIGFNNWAANAGAPGFVTQPVPPAPNPDGTLNPPTPQSKSFFPPPASAARPVGFQGGSGDVIGAPQAGTQFANVQYSAPQINIAALKQHLQSQGIQPNQISGLLNAISQYRAGQPAASYGEGSSVSQALGPAMEAGFPGYQGGISDIGYPPFVGPNMVYHADKGSNWIGEFDPRYTFQRYWRGTGAVMPMGGMGPVMGARPFVHPVRPVPPVRF